MNHKKHFIDILPVPLNIPHSRSLTILISVEQETVEGAEDEDRLHRLPQPLDQSSGSTS